MENDMLEIFLSKFRFFFLYFGSKFEYRRRYLICKYKDLHKKKIYIYFFSKNGKRIPRITVTD